MRSVNINFDGETHNITPDFSFVEKLETRFTPIDFLKQVETYNPKLSDVAWVLYCALPVKMSYKEVGEKVLEDRSEAIASATDIVISVLNTGPEKPIKKK